MSVASSTISLSAPALVQSITLRVRFLSISRARLWLATPLMRLAAAVAGCKVEIEVGDRDGA
ncbi:hypothetical protein WBP07_12955 [Novosphingobium sp. BL-8A]|uniref:hypothetical protein n=1 Tax=Novosphingobium sp. BL-8A TaxID=3127639 RepID=UPI00375732FE